MRGNWREFAVFERNLQNAVSGAKKGVYSSQLEVGEDSICEEGVCRLGVFSVCGVLVKRASSTRHTSYTGRNGSALTGKRSLLERVELMEGVQSAGLGRPAGPRALRRAFDLPILAADHRTTQGRGGVGPEGRCEADEGRR